MTAPQDRIGTLDYLKNNSKTVIFQSLKVIIRKTGGELRDTNLVIDPGVT